KGGATTWGADGSGRGKGREDTNATDPVRTCGAGDGLDDRVRGEQPRRITGDIEQRNHSHGDHFREDHGHTARHRRHSSERPADVSATWTVWGRALGTPGGKANMTTCATTAGLDGILGTADDEVICSMGTLSLDRTKGKQTFTNVSGDLLFMTITVDPTTNASLATCLGVTSTSTVTVSLFNGCLQNYFWNYDNQGLRLLQLRFYPAA